MAIKFDVKKFALAMLFGIVFITIISSLLANYTDFEVIKTGNAFIVIFIAVYITLIFIAAHDWKFERGEWIMLILVAIALVISGYVLKKFMPEIFSFLPQSTKEVFSAIIK